ncbi:hypothetical protein STEG23_034428 [Scotinomys teguina]
MLTKTTLSSSVGVGKKEEESLKLSRENIRNFPVIAIHRGMAQEECLSHYQQCKDFHWCILVATNLFGRGMGIEQVNIIINYDMLEDSDTYLHPVAHAGCFGTKGLAVTFVSNKNDAKILNDV